MELPRELESRASLPELAGALPHRQTTPNGKIARLARAIRGHLNQRLDEGQEAEDLAARLPESLVAAQAEAPHPIKPN